MPRIQQCRDLFAILSPSSFGCSLQNQRRRRKFFEVLAPIWRISKIGQPFPLGTSWRCGPEGRLWRFPLGTNRRGGPSGRIWGFPLGTSELIDFPLGTLDPPLPPYHTFSLGFTRYMVQTFYIPYVQTRMRQRKCCFITLMISARGGPN